MTLTTEPIAWGLSAVLVVGLWSYRRAYLKAIGLRDKAEATACKALDEARGAAADRDYWQRACRASYSAHDAIQKLPDAKVKQLMHDLARGFDDELPSEIGTSSNPLKLVRITDQSLNDSARFSSVADLIGERP